MLPRIGGPIRFGGGFGGGFGGFNQQPQSVYSLNHNEYIVYNTD